MSNALQTLNKLAKDEAGAALVEYTVLLGIMLVAVVATIGLVRQTERGCSCYSAQAVAPDLSCRVAALRLSQ
jgi:Flp pilus assembly pilin Flp